MQSAPFRADSTSGHVIYPTEAEAFITELTTFKISEIGSDRWSRQRERLEQLTLQAVYNVSQQTDEFVKEFLVDLDKLGVVLHELLCVELWRDHVFPELPKFTATPTSGFPAYLVLYTEGTLVSLLETSLFYQESCEHVQEFAVDLVDYCHRQLIALLAVEEQREGKGHGGMPLVEEEEDGSSEDEDGQEKSKIFKEMEGQRSVIQFGVAMKCLSILHYLTNHLSVLPIGISTRLLNTQDVPSLLVRVLELKPWIRQKEKGEGMEYYEDGRWLNVEDRSRLAKIEGQVWLTLYQVLLDKECQQKYEITHHSKTQLLNLRKFLSEPVLEQLPPLVHLLRYLEQLSLMDPPATKADLILEQVPVMYDKLCRTNAKKWQTIAKEHSKLLLEPTPAQLQESAKRWTAVSNLDILEDLVAGPPKCAVCGGVATKRCSRCRNEWYCGRQCQVRQWKKHKPSCDVIAGVKASDS